MEPHLIEITTQLFTFITHGYCKIYIKENKKMSFRNNKLIIALGFAMLVSLTGCADPASPLPGADKTNNFPQASVSD